jgi:NADH dehydrogenase
MLCPHSVIQMDTSMVTQTRKVATVFGGAGFIGRYLVPHLVARGYVIRVAGRDPERAALLKPLGGVGQIVPLYAPLTDAAAIGRAIEGAEVVVNLVGILAERRAGDFAKIQGTGPRLIADAAARAGVRHLVHVSAIGASGTSRSGYGRSKAAGEAAMAAGFPQAVILRPSIVFGAEDQFFNRFGEMARLYPVMPVISGATKFQPVYVGDVAEAIMAALALPPEAPRVYELGGPRTFTFRELLTYILTETRRNRPLLAVPPGIARLQARILERLPGKLLTTDQLEMLGQDNVVSGTVPGFAALGMTPKPVELIVPTYLDRYADQRKRR